MGSHGHDAGSSETSSSWSQRSRPDVIGTSPPVRRTTRHECTFGAASIASSAVRFSGTVDAAAPGLVLRDEHLAAHVHHAAGQRVGREPAEHDGVGSAEAGAGEHGHGELGDHPHVDPHGRALADPHLSEGVRHPDDVPLKVGVGDRPRVAGLAFPVVRDPVAEPGLDVAVDAVVGDIEDAAEVPPGIRQLPLRQRVEVLEPAHPLAGLGLPEGIRIDVVDLGLGVRLRCEVRIRREPPLLVEQGVDRVVAHRAASSTAADGSRPYGKSVIVSQPSSVTRSMSSTRTPPNPCR